MRFPLRVVAIMGVEVGSGMEGGMFGFLCGILFSSSPGAFCCHFRLAHIKESRAQAGRLENSNCTMLPQRLRHGKVYKASHMKEGGKGVILFDFLWHLSRGTTQSMAA